MTSNFLKAGLTALLVFCICIPGVSAVEWCGEQDLFFWNSSSDISGYLVLNNIPELADTGYRYVAVSSATGSKTIASFVTPAGSPGEIILAPGLWRFRTYLNVSSAVGSTTYEFKIYNRSADGTETDLFYGKAITEEVNSLTQDEYLLSYARRNYTHFFAGDRLVIKVNASTTSVTARNAWIALAGNTNASMVEVSYFECEQFSTSESMSDVTVWSIGFVMIVVMIVGAGIILRK